MRDIVFSCSLFVVGAVVYKHIKSKKNHENSSCAMFEIFPVTHNLRRRE